MAYHSKLSLFSGQGERKYLNQHERQAFLAVADKLPLERMLFCYLLHCTGARISEIYDLTPNHIDFHEKLVIIRTLKRRRKDLFRQIPLPFEVLTSIRNVLDIKEKSKTSTPHSGRLWSFSKRTASRIIKQVMVDAKITGIKASALGLRHGFAVHALTHVPLTQVKKWMGHGYLSTTAIYLNVSGVEERKLAEKMWLK